MVMKGVNTMINIDVSKFLIQMQKAVMTNEELAKAAGVNENTVSRIRCGYPARPSTVRKLCAALNCQPSDILATGEGGC